MKNESVDIAKNEVIALVVRMSQSQLLLAIGFGLCCSAGLLLTAGGMLNQAGYVDPYVYAGYIHDYPALLERFGRTYFSTRIAYIYPERLLTHLFGLEAGYFALRFGALAAAAAAVFVIGLRFYGCAPAILAAVWLSFTPWLPRSLLWTHPDGMAVVYLLLGVALLIVPARGRLIYHLAAGAAFAFAVNCNLFLLAICGVLGPAWVYFYRNEGIAWLARALLALAVGFFGAYLVLALFLYFRFPGYGFLFELTSIGEASSLLGGRAQTWHMALSSIIWENHDFKLLIPITLLLAAVFLLIVRRSTLPRRLFGSTDFGIFAVCYLAGIICLFLIFQFGLHGLVLGIPYYAIYILPSCVLSLIFVAGEAERLGGSIFGPVAVYGGAGLILFWWLAGPVLLHFQIETIFYFWVAVAAVTAIAAIALSQILLASVALIVGVALLSMCLYQDGYYQIRSATAEEQTTEWDIYRGAMFLQKFVNANVPPSRSIGFWYTGDHQSFLNSIQSVYLWGYTRVFPEYGVGMPLVDDEFRDKIARGMLPLMRPIQSLILLGASDAETDAGLGALKAAGLPFDDVKVTRTHFQGELLGYTAVLVGIESPHQDIGTAAVQCAGCEP